jgi:hypothetical protein
MAGLAPAIMELLPSASTPLMTHDVMSREGEVLEK